MDQQTRAFLDIFPVTYETINALTRYKEMLFCENKKTNLVAESTLPNIWTRHFLDSAQLMPMIPDSAKTIADMGAGAGFPSLVLAILAKNDNRPIDVHAIESIGKKAEFLKAVVRELKLNVTVHQERIENLRDLKADVVTARALKPLPELLKYANALTRKDSLCLFLKGKGASEELTLAEKYWTFNAEIHRSRSDETGKILAIKNLRPKR